MATSRRKSSGPLRGRTRVALGLLCFMTVAGVVIWRRSAGNALTRQASELERELRLIKSDRLVIERKIDSAMSRQAVVPAAERRLGMHVAPDVQTRALVDTAGAR